MFFVVRKLNQYLTRIGNYYYFGNLIDSCVFGNKKKAQQARDDIAYELRVAERTFFNPQWVQVEELPIDIFLAKGLSSPHKRCRVIIGNSNGQH